MNKNSLCLAGVLLLVLPAGMHLAKTSLQLSGPSRAERIQTECCLPTPVPVPSRVPQSPRR